MRKKSSSFLAPSAPSRQPQNTHTPLLTGHKKGPVNNVGGHKKPVRPLGWCAPHDQHINTTLTFFFSVQRKPQNLPRKRSKHQLLPLPPLVAMQRLGEVPPLVEESTMLVVESQDQRTELLPRNPLRTIRGNVGIHLISHTFF